jgi:hypothetical protein
VPQRGLLTVRIGGAAVVAVIAIATWRSDWLSADGVAFLLMVVAISCAALTSRCLRRTTVRDVPMLG